LKREYRRNVLNGQVYIEPYKIKIVAFPLKMTINGKSENIIQSLLKGKIFEFSREKARELFSELFEK